MSDSSVIDDDLDVTNEQARIIDQHCLDAQRAAEKHLAACDDYMAELDECGANLSAIEELVQRLGPDPALGPYCGCLTCQIRETLFAAWPHVEKAVLVEWGIRRNQSRR